MVPLGMSKGLADVMDMCPVNKILYGSDGFIIPEFYWFAAVVFRRKLGALLQEIIAQGMYNEGYALDVAKMILSGNAANFYGFAI
jgi:predicted TIM-barrel fold metal-dependent hydrolase